MAEIAQYMGTGKRKTSVARVILRPGDGKTWFNGKAIEEYFPRLTHRSMVLAPLRVAAGFDAASHDEQQTDAGNTQYGSGNAQPAEPQEHCCGEAGEDCGNEPGHQAMLADAPRRLLIRE